MISLFPVGEPINPDPMTYLDMFLTNGAFNQTGYSNPKYDDLIKHAKTDLLYNLPKRWKALKEAEGILLNDAAVVPLYQKGTSYLQRPYLKDFYVYGANTYKYAYIKKQSQLMPSLPIVVPLESSKTRSKV